MWKTVIIWKCHTKSHRVLWREFSLNAAHKAARYQLCLFVSYVQALCLYTSIYRMYTRMNNLLNQFITDQEVDFLMISSLFWFLYLSSSITGEKANEKFWRNFRLLLHTSTISYQNFRSIRSLQFNKWISWLLTHYSHFYIFPVLLLEK